MVWLILYGNRVGILGPDPEELVYQRRPMRKRALPLLTDENTVVKTLALRILDRQHRMTHIDRCKNDPTSFEDA